LKANVQVVIGDYQILQKMTHISIFFSDCVHMKPDIVKARNPIL